MQKKPREIFRTRFPKFVPDELDLFSDFADEPRALKNIKKQLDVIKKCIRKEKTTKNDLKNERNNKLTKNTYIY